MRARHASTSPRARARQLASNAELSRYCEFIHFACTSEDINNLAYGLMLTEARAKHLLPSMRQLIDTTATLAEEVRRPVRLACTQKRH